MEIYEKSSGVIVGQETIEVQARREHLTEAELNINIADPHLWSPDDPFLYKTKTTVLLNDEVIDVQEDQFGLRDFERRGKYFYLNGEKVLLRGTNLNLQRFFEDPDCRDLAWDRDWVKQLIIDDPKEVNWNFMRVCIGILPDFWYDLADEYGMMFQNEWNYWQAHGWDEHMGNDEMDEPHPYDGLRPWITIENFEKKPYPLGDLDYRNAKNIKSIKSDAAQLVNEYGWIWLWRDGRAAKLTNRLYNYYLGDASDTDINREFQAYWLQCETEWLRSIRQHAGVLAFVHLTNNYGYTGDWYINDIKDLEPGPTLSWFIHAFAPSAVFINHPDERYMKQFKPHEPGSQIHFSLRAINDFGEKETGDVTIKLLNKEGESVWSQVQRVTIEPFGEKNYPVVLDIPEEAGGYTLVTEFEGNIER